MLAMLLAAIAAIPVAQGPAQAGGDPQAPQEHQERQKRPEPAKDHPLCKDKTGLAWVLPFQAALAKAKAEARLLMIKPVAFGTSPDGGW